MTRAQGTSRSDAVERLDVLVDARNVERSIWPNIPSERLVEGVRAWARHQGLRPVIVFDGRAPGGLEGELELDDGTLLVGTGRESADDWIARAAEGWHRAGRPFWLVTSDRELRARASAGAVRTIGGGTMARVLAAGE